jgi:hypothetical protein
MERHASAPDGYDLQGMFQVETEVRELIKKDVSKARSHNEPQGYEKNEILKLCALQTKLSGLSLAGDEEIAGEETQHIHETIPANLEWADLNQIGIYFWEWKHCY